MGGKMKLMYLPYLFLMIPISLGAVESKRDYYEVLGVARDATIDDIRKAYRRLALAIHPDRDPKNSDGVHFQKAAEAYEVLSDTDKRRIYDRLGSQPTHETSNSSNASPRPEGMLWVHFADFLSAYRPYDVEKMTHEPEWLRTLKMGKTIRTHRDEEVGVVYLKRIDRERGEVQLEVVAPRCIYQEMGGNRFVADFYTFNYPLSTLTKLFFFDQDVLIGNDIEGFRHSPPLRIRFWTKKPGFLVEWRGEYIDAIEFDQKFEVKHDYQSEYYHPYILESGDSRLPIFLTGWPVPIPAGAAVGALEGHFMYAVADEVYDEGALWTTLRTINLQRNGRNGGRLNALRIVTPEQHRKLSEELLALPKRKRKAINDSLDRVVDYSRARVIWPSQVRSSEARLAYLAAGGRGISNVSLVFRNCLQVIFHAFARSPQPFAGNGKSALQLQNDY
jgi:DnaJ domain